MIREMDCVENHRITHELSNEYITVRLEYRMGKLYHWSILPFNGTGSNNFKFNNGCIVRTQCIVDLLEEAVRFIQDTKARLASASSPKD